VSKTPGDAVPQVKILKFGSFELDIESERLLKNDRTVRLQPQPFKLLCLLAGQAGRLVTREEIQAALWSGDTFVDFEQGVNFAIKQVREALGENADHPVYVQTVPKRGYRFVAPVAAIPAKPGPPPRPFTDLNLQKVLWANIAELRIEEDQRLRRRKALRAVLVIVGAVAALVALFLLRTLWR
jgi:DNA-binding winged helix-turn-helix (wHTH) protein